MKRSLMVSISLMVLAGVAGAAIDDVIIWNGVRTVAQLEDTLQNGYSDTTGMRLWWDFSNPAQLGNDVIGSYDGNVYGNAGSLATDTPSADFAAGGLAASGFTSNDSRIVVNPGIGVYPSRTYEMWIRNPQLTGNPPAVFFAINTVENPGNDNCVKRMWINADGSVTMSDRGSHHTPSLQNVTSTALTWQENTWYQISVVLEATGGELHDVRVYRGQQGGSQVELLLDYGSSRFGSAHWLAVGGHTEQSYYRNYVGKGGYLGEDTYIPEPATMALLALGTVLLRRRSA